MSRTCLVLRLVGLWRSRACARQDAGGRAGSELAAVRCAVNKRRHQGCRRSHNPQDDHGNVRCFTCKFGLAAVCRKLCGRTARSASHLSGQPSAGDTISTSAITTKGTTVLKQNTALRPASLSAALLPRGSALAHPPRRADPTTGGAQAAEHRCYDSTTVVHFASVWPGAPQFRCAH